MRLLVIFFLVLIRPDAWAQQDAPPNLLNDVEWLLGTWKRTNTKPGRSGYERWEKINDQELQGVGVSLNGSDTLFIEKLKIILRNDTLYYVADVSENNRLVYFKFIALREGGFTCENPSHDFPKKIMYNKQDQYLNAQISGDGKVIDYFFVRER